MSPDKIWIPMKMRMTGQNWPDHAPHAPRDLPDDIKKQHECLKEETSPRVSGLPYHDDANCATGGAHHLCSIRHHLSNC